MAARFIAVVDIGKTNKKVVVFDERLKAVDSAYCGFEEKIDGELHVEDLERMSDWVLDQLAVFARTYPIAAVSVTTHGATIVCIDRSGRLALPPVAYTTEPSEEFDREFYSVCGEPAQLQRSTATAAFGRLINAAKTIFYVKKRYPGEFANVDTILNMPQYFGYLLTGARGAEPTYVGCHTYLLDFASRTYSSVADRLGVRDKLPPLAPHSWDVLGKVSESASRRTGLSRDCVVTMGIHDSNSSLLPYLVKGHRDFVLNSTGTWCVAMHPTAKVQFNDDEIGKLVFYNLDAFFQPVKTSIFMGGQEFETWRGVFGPLCGRNDYPGLDLELCRRIVEQKKLFILPSVVRGTGLFPDSSPRVVDGDQEYALDEVRGGARVPAFLRKFETASAVLNLSLVAQTTVAMGMAGFGGAGSVFTEGGFRRNDTYNALLSAMYPSGRVATTKLDEATAFGAAILARAALGGTTPESTSSLFEIDIVDVKRPQVPGLQEYIAEWHRRVAAR